MEIDFSDIPVAAAVLAGTMAFVGWQIGNLLGQLRILLTMIARFQEHMLVAQQRAEQQWDVLRKHAESVADRRDVFSSSDTAQR